MNKRKSLNIRSVKAGVHPDDNRSAPEAAVKNRRPFSTFFSVPEVFPEQEGDCAYSTVELQSNTLSARPTLQQSIHGTVWESAVEDKDQNAVRGLLPRRSFGIRSVAGDLIGADVLMLFRAQKLREMVTLTNRELFKLKLSETSPGEVLRFIGILMLCNRYEFGERRT